MVELSTLTYKFSASHHMSVQRTLSIRSRPFDPSDYHMMVEISNANYPDYPVSISEQQSRDESVEKSNLLQKRTTFLDSETSMIVGFGTIAHVVDMFHPQKFGISIVVDPAYQQRGIGTTIYNTLSRQLADLNAIVVWTMTKEDLTRQTEFFLHRGFVGKNRSWESRLDLPTFDPSKFQHYLTRVAEDGVTFTTLAQERKDDAFLHQLHEFVQLINEDMPREAPFTPLSYEAWRAFSYDNPRLIPEGYWIAKKDSQIVGLSDLHRNEKDPAGLSQDDTGVRREYRGRGIATALKVRLIEWAKQKGYSSIKTWNDSKNAPMLAVNTRLGFKRQVGWVFMQKDIAN